MATVMPGGHWNVLSKLGKTLASACVLFTLAAAFVAPNASAGYNGFCPSQLYPWNDSRALQGYSTSGDRCMALYHTVWIAGGFNKNDYYTCIAFKAQANGGGPDQWVPAGCGYGSSSTDSLTYGHEAYTTLINHQGVPHTGFYGTAQYTG